VKPTVGKLTAGIIALMLLLGVFGVYQSVAQAQAASLTLTPVKAAIATTENTWICAKCGGDDAKFDISVTDTGANQNAGLETIKTTVKNGDLGTLGTKTSPDSNPKEVTLIESGTNTGIFIRRATAVNKTTGLVSDVLTGAADGTPTTTILTDASLTAAILRDADESAIVGGTLKYTSGSASGTAQTITAFSATDGTVTTAAFGSTPTNGSTYELYPLVNLADFSGQDLSVSYTPSGGLGETATISNDEVKATLLTTSPAGNLITKKGTTVLVTFSADITDTSSGFPAKVADLVTNNNTAGNKGTIKLTLGTVAVSLKKADFTAITDGYRLSIAVPASDLLNLANKMPWWVEAEDLAGNLQETSESISSATTAGTAGASVASTLTDSTMANGSGVCGTCFVGRKVSSTIDGVKQTKAITGYAPATGTFTFSTGFTLAGTGSTTATTITDANLIGKTAATIVGAQIDSTNGTVTAITAFDTATGAITAATGNIAQGSAVAFTIRGIGFASGTAYTVDKTMLVTIDGVVPVVDTVVTGDTWVASKAAGSRLRTGLNAARNSIRVTVTDASGLDSATVVPSAFSVSGDHTISSVLLVDISGENASPSVARVPNDIFITLGEDLSPSNERPKVTITGGVIKDKAGNALAGSTPKASDKLGPSLTVSLDKTLSNSKVKATITSDELLSSNPTGTVTTLTSTTTGALGAVAGTAPGTATTQTGTLVYTKTISKSALGTAIAGNEFNLYVLGSDTVSNSGKAGHLTDGTNASAITFELDQWLNNGNPPEVKVVDKVAKATSVSGVTAGVPKVDAVDPLIVTMDFNKGCDNSGGSTEQLCPLDGESAEYTGDSHKTVTLTSASVKITFSDATTETITYDVATQVSSPDNKRFTLPILAPKVGKYKLTIKAEDAAGNIALKSPTATSAQSLTYEWEVTKAKPVKLGLSPGWNLISLPFQPSNPAINSLISATHPISIVMSYDNATNVWLVSRRDAVSGLFTGDVAVMSADTAYFVLTDSFETLDVLRPPLATASAAPPVPPAIAVFEGWNLVPVLSNQATPPDGVLADTYFGTLGKTWLSALSWNPLTRTWLTIQRASATGTTHDRCDSTPGVTTTTPEVCTGEGVWLWVTEDGVLIP
jgi:hypothetical protein